MNNTKLIVISTIIALGLIGLSWVLSGSNDSGRFENPKQGLESRGSNDLKKTELSELGSAHDHMSMNIFIEDNIVDLSKERYMLKNRNVHFENNDGVVIHKHTIGVTLAYFLSTLGMSLTKDCITLDTGRQYCTSSSGKIMQVIVNGVAVDDASKYDMKHGDKILVNYGDDDETKLRFKFNSISDVPSEVNLIIQ